MVKRVRDSEEGKGASAEVREGVSAGAAAAAAITALQVPAVVLSNAAPDVVEADKASPPPASATMAPLASPAKCSNCKCRPVAEVTNCFADWCYECDSTLWATRHDDSEISPSISEFCDHDVDVGSGRSLSPSVDHTRDSSNSHDFFRRADFVTLGQPIVKTHRFVAGLTELQFQNCVVKVRIGYDLSELIRRSSFGSVALRNLSTNGCVPDTLLPTFIFIKYISSFSI